MWTPSTWVEYSKPQAPNSTPFFEYSKTERRKICAPNHREQNLLGCALWQWQKQERERRRMAKGKERQSLTSVLDKAKQQEQQGKGGRGFGELYWRMEFFSASSSHCGPLCLPPLSLVIWLFLLCFHHDVATTEGSFYTSLLLLHV